MGLDQNMFERIPQSRLEKAQYLRLLILHLPMMCSLLSLPILMLPFLSYLESVVKELI